MKKIILTLFVLVMACQVTAQGLDDVNKRPERIGIGLRLGGNLASYKYTDNPALDTMAFDSLWYRVRPVLGLNMEIPLFDGIVFVSPEVSLAGRGDSRLYPNSSLDTMRYQVKVYYLEARLPISVAIPVTNNIKPYMYVAPSFGLALDTVGPLKSVIRQGSAKQHDYQEVGVSKGNMSTYDYGLALGAGLRYRFNFSTFSLVLKAEGGYHWGFRDTYSELEHNNYSQAQNVNTYNIKGKRLNRGWEGSISVILPLKFYPDDCFYWSDVNKSKHRGAFGF